MGACLLILMQVNVHYDKGLSSWNVKEGTDVRKGQRIKSMLAGWWQIRQQSRNQDGSLL